MLLIRMLLAPVCDEQPMLVHRVSADLEYEFGSMRFLSNDRGYLYQPRIFSLWKRNNASAYEYLFGIRTDIHCTVTVALSGIFKNTLQNIAAIPVPPNRPEISCCHAG
jgi:hypothetical protein